MEINSCGFSPLEINNVVETARRQEQKDFAQVLRQAQQEQDDAQLKKACQEIEALFVQHLWTRMRATIPKSDFLPEGMAAKLYEEMLDAEYSKIIAESPRGLGLGQMLYQQLKPTVVSPEKE